MEPAEIKALLEANLTLDQLQVEGDGSHYSVIAVGAVFEELSRVKRQQAISKLLAEKVSDGSIHALSIKTYTPAEWEKAKNFVMPG